MASASSNIISLTPVVNNCLVPANSLISFRTTSIPRASDALSSSVMDRYEASDPYMRLAAATIVLVFPVPGGPYRSKCGKLSLSMRLVKMLTMSSWATKSSSLVHRRSNDKKRCTSVVWVTVYHSWDHSWLQPRRQGLESPADTGSIRCAVSHCAGHLQFEWNVGICTYFSGRYFSTQGRFSCFVVAVMVVITR